MAKSTAGQQKRQQGDPHRSVTIGTAKQYCYALINNDDKKLNDMTMYTGSIGSSQSNISTFRKFNPTKIGGIMTNGKQATVQFANENGEVQCIGLFTVVDQGHVLGNWDLFQKA